MFAAREGWLPPWKGATTCRHRAEAIVAEIKAFQGDRSHSRRKRPQDSPTNRRGQEDPKQPTGDVLSSQAYLFFMPESNAPGRLGSHHLLCRAALSPHIYCVHSRMALERCLPKERFPISAASRSHAMSIFAGLLHHNPSFSDIRPKERPSMGGQEAREMLFLPNRWTGTSADLWKAPKPPSQRALLPYREKFPHHYARERNHFVPS